MSKICLNCCNFTENKKFCNRSCSAIYNNKISPKRKAKISISCILCNNLVFLKKDPRGGFYNRKYCDNCQYIRKNKTCNVTKILLLSRRKNWQSANSSIRKDARKIYFSANLPKECYICKYNNHIEICHIKQVKDFAETSALSDINAIDNLIALCRNHHWELDNGLINLVEMFNG